MRKEEGKELPKEFSEMKSDRIEALSSAKYISYGEEVSSVKAIDLLETRTDFLRYLQKEEPMEIELIKEEPMIIERTKEEPMIIERTKEVQLTKEEPMII